jgi:hypothetical protein
VDRAVDIPVIGHRDRLLTQRGNPVDQFFDVASPVKQGVLGMQMQMCEFGHGIFDSSRQVVYQNQTVGSSISAQ